MTEQRQLYVLATLYHKNCLEVSTRYIDMTSRQIKIARIAVSLIATLTASLHSVGAWENIQYGVRSRPNNRNISQHCWAQHSCICCCDELGFLTQV